MTTDTDFLYFSSAQDAETELLRRRTDPVLIGKVRAMFGEPPEFLARLAPAGVFSRYVASPTLEFEEFFSKVKTTTLKPLFLEFTKDKFVARNPEKYGVCRMRFYDSSYPHRNNEIAKIVDFKVHEGKPLKTISTIGGESLVTMHHRLLSTHAGSSVDVYDFSDWFLPNRGSDRWSYYLRYLALFLVDAVLFENFLLDPREDDFTRSVVIPAYRTIHDVLDISPLIVRAVPAESEEDPRWCYYDKNLQAHI